MSKLARRSLILALLLGASYLLWPVLWSRLDSRFYDFFATKRSGPTWSDVVVVEIDRRTADEVFSAPLFPLSRHQHQHARLVRQLSAAGPRAIVLDLRLDPDAFDDAPRELAAAIADAGNVYLVTSLGGVSGEDGGAVVEAGMPHPALLEAAAGALLADVRVDPDGVLRRFQPDRAARTLGLETVPEALAGRRVTRAVPIEFPTAQSPLPRMSYVDVLQDSTSVRARVAGRIVFVGSILDDVSDTVVIPHQRRADGVASPLLPGVHGLAATTATLIDGAPVRDAAWPLTLLWNLLWIVAAVALMPRRRPVLAVFLLAGVAVVALLATGLLHVFAGLVFPAGLLWGTLGLAGGVTVVDQHLQTRRELYAVLKRSHDELEEKVAERTVELQRANSELEGALKTVRETQAQLVQSEKMASLGNLVAGIAHEINNPVGAFNAALDTSKRCIDKLRRAVPGLEDDETAKKTLNIMNDSVGSAETAGERVATIVRSLKNFARLDEAEFQEVDIHEGLDSALTLLEHEIGDDVELKRDYGQLPKIRCYARELNQAFMNVLRNAIQAVEKEGAVTIATRVVSDDAVVEIRDTGPGIAPDILSRVFDPGFTTRGVGVGTGLGLSITYNVVHKHGGEIRIENGASVGTVVTISLPLVGSPAED